MGLRIDGFEKRVVINSPKVPARLVSLTIKNLKVSDGAVSFRLKHNTEGPAVEVLEKHDSVSVEIKE
jgi:hypothetical protein